MEDNTKIQQIVEKLVKALKQAMLIEVWLV